MDIKLFIGDMPVDLNDEIQILFNWTETDLSNPTNYRNGYSKTITLEGTDNNNELFGHFWDLERYQQYGGNSRSTFNPSYRVPFVLYHNGSVYERGYVKLEKVIKENGINKYEISLFGGLGSFLYNLSVDWNTGEKKTLADLDYFRTITGVSFTDLGFILNKDTVKDAWDNANTTNVFNKYYHLNFAPTYRGLPDNLDTDKVLINFSGSSSSLTETYSGYSTYNGYALGKLPAKLTEEEVKDYRSYLQTPVIRVKSVIDAICKPYNNKGKYDEGYTVDLDTDFFNDKNPYYSKSWMTLNNISISPIEGTGEVTDYSSLSVYTQYGDSSNTTFVFDLGEHKAGRMKISFDLDITVPSATSSDSSLWLASWSVTPGIYNVCINALGIQAYASNSYGSSDTVMASSKISWNTNNLTRGASSRFYFDYQDAKDAGYFIPIQDRDVISSDGYFQRQNSGKYRWHKKIELECDQPEDARYLKINIQLANSQGDSSKKNKLATSKYLGGNYHLYDWSAINADFVGKQFLLEEKDSSNFYSNKYIEQSQVLATSFSPAEFLVSYCKMFGLYIYKDLAEDKIYIKTRSNFFKRDNIIDINDKIDLSQSVEINPLYAESNFYSMSNDSEKSKNEEEYTEKYSKVFGQKIIETGNEFNADTTELVDSALKGAIQTKEQSIYFFKKEDNNPYVYNGFSYSLYKNGLYDEETYTVEIPKKDIFLSFNPFNQEEVYYDSVGKIQLRDKSNKGLSAEGVLLFFNGYEDVSGYGYYMTDDLSVMNTLNNNPCWLMTNSEYDTNGNKIAIELNSIPRFSRYYEGNKWMIYSMDYGSPRQLYIPNFSNNDDANIYHNYFENYFKDLYDINTKVINCYVHTDYLLNEDYLRNIYWFRNGLWRLNKIVDYNPDSENSTLCEFVKIQDLDDLTNYNPTTDRWIKITLDRYEIGQSGGTIIGTVITSDNYGWDIDSITYDPASPLPRGLVTVTPETYGSSGSFTLSVPSNIRDAREVTINVNSDYNGQNASGSTAFSQPGVEYTFDVQPTSLTGGTLEYSKTFNVTNPYYYDWSIASKPDWVTVSPSSITNGQTGTTGTTAATVTASKNTTEVERTGTVVLTESTYNHTYSISVWQAGYVFSISPDSLSFDKDGESKTVTINNPYGYSWIVDSKPEWITTARTSSGNLTVTADPNIVFERTGTLVIKDTDFNHTYSVSITQESGYVFSIDPTYFYFLCDYELDDTLTIENPNQMAWTVTNIPAWVTISPTAGTGTSVSISVDENIGFERSGLSITVNETLCDQHYTFDIVQESGYYFELLPSTGFSFTSASTSQTMHISCKGYNWKITSKPAWITTNYTTGFGDTNVTVTAANNIGFERSGVIKVKNLDYNLEYTLEVSQESGYVFNLSPSSFNFNSAGTAQQLTITNPNGYHWYIDGQPSWLSFSQTAGTESATITVSASVNGWDVRTDDFYVYEDTISGDRTEIDVTQDEGYTLTYSPTSFLFNVTSGSSTITINNPDNYNLQFTSDKNWLSFSPTATTSSGQVTVNYTDNGSSSDDRTATITINNISRSRSHTIGVRQAGYLFRVEPTSAETLTFASGGETTFIMIMDGNNLEWEVTSYPSWLTPNVTAGNGTRSVEFTAPTNAGRPERTGQIKVLEKAFNREYIVNVKQYSGYKFEVSPTTFNFAGTGETKTFTITNPYGYSWQMVSPCGWLSFNPSTGNSNATVSVTAAANGWDARNCTFYVEETTYGGGAQMTANQASGYTLSYSPTAFTFNAISGSSTLTITNPDNYNLTISSNANWLTVSPTATTSASQNVTVSAVNNSSSSDRSGVITITNNSRSKTHTINVSQAGYQFRVEPTSAETLTFASGGETTFIMIYNGNNFNWEVTSYPSWLTPNVTTGNTTRSVEFTAATNAGRPERTGTIVVRDKAFNIDYTVNVKQLSGYQFSVSPTTFNFNSAGTAQQFTITNTYGYAWQIVSPCGWLTFSQTAGTASATVTVSASPNGWSSRNCTFYVEETTYGGGAEMTASQASGYQFSYSPSEFEFNCKAGSSTLTINNPFGYRWSITNVPSWLTVSPSTGVSSASVTLTVQGNSSSNNRWQDIVLNELSMSHSYSINVEQYGNEFEVTPTTFNFNSTGGSKTMNIYDADNLGWTITNKPNWITLSATAGTGNASITITTIRNTGGQRSGTFAVNEQTFGGSTTISVGQDSGYEFTVSPTSFTGLNRTGGTVTMTITNPNGYSWELYSVPSWITPSITAGTSSTSVTFTYAANTYNDTRETESMGIVDLTNSNYIELYFEQDALLTPSIDSITATVENNPQPTGNTFTMQNTSSTYGLYGDFDTNPEVTLTGDWGANVSRNMNNPVPFNITAFQGAVTKTSTTTPYPSNVTISINNSSYYNMSVGSGGYVNWTGSIPINQGDNVKISFS